MAVGALRPQKSVCHLPGRLHDRFYAVRRCAVARADGAVPPAAGRVRRRAGPAQPSHHARHLPAAAARVGHGALGCRRDGRSDPRPHARRLSHRPLQLALRLLRQPPIRHPGHRGAGRVPAQECGQVGPAVRLAGLRRARPGSGLLPAHARPRPGPGLVRLTRGRHRGRARGARNLPVRCPPADGAKAVLAAARVPGSQLRRQPRGHVLRRHDPAGEFSPPRPLAANAGRLPRRRRRAHPSPARAGDDGGNDDLRTPRQPHGPATAHGAGDLPAVLQPL